MTWIIYLADMLPRITTFLFVMGGVFLFLGVLMLPDYEDKRNFKSTIRMWIYGFIFIAIGIFIPSKGTIYGMYAVDKIEEFVNNDEIIKQIPHKTIETLDKWLDNQLKKDK